MLSLWIALQRSFSTPISISRTIRKRRNGSSISSLSNLLEIQEASRMLKMEISPLIARSVETWQSALSMVGCCHSIILSSCKLPTAADDPSIVSNLRFTPSAFDSFTKNTEVQYTLKNPVTVNISIVKKDSSGQEFLSKPSQKISTKPRERIGTRGLVIRERFVRSDRHIHRNSSN